MDFKIAVGYRGFGEIDFSRQHAAPLEVITISFIYVTVFQVFYYREIWICIRLKKTLNVPLGSTLNQKVKMPHFLFTSVLLTAIFLFIHS